MVSDSSEAASLNANDGVVRCKYENKKWKRRCG